MEQLLSPAPLSPSVGSNTPNLPSTSAVSPTGTPSAEPKPGQLTSTDSPQTSHPKPEVSFNPNYSQSSEAVVSNHSNSLGGKVSPPTPGHLRHYKLFFIIAVILIVAAGTALYIIN